MVKIMDEFLEDYNQVNTAQMKLVLFNDAVRHVCRIGRVIRQPLGNALLLGMGGKLCNKNLISSVECFSCTHNIKHMSHKVK